MSLRGVYERSHGPNLKHYPPMARLCRVRGRQCILLHLQLLRQISPSYRSHIALHLAGLLPSNPDYCPSSGADPPERSVCFCKLCK